jgi:predicted DsbA family dithiol-disulfide isomerase
VAVKRTWIEAGERMRVRAEIISFSDPFCSWCWASEPALLALQERYRGQIQIRYVMGGLVRDMAGFFDSSNAIRTTAQVAPHWRLVAERTGQPIDERLMEEIGDPHFSTWPSAEAVKAAGLQGEEVGTRYLRRLRRGALAEKQHIERPEVRMALAREVSGLSVKQLQRDLIRGAGRAAFEHDLAFCKKLGVTGLPTHLFQGADPSAQKILVGGCRDLPIYERVLGEVASELIPRPPRSVDELLASYGPLTTRELAEIRGEAPGALASVLAADPFLERHPVRGGELWALPVPHASA